MILYWIVLCTLWFKRHSLLKVCVGTLSYLNHYVTYYCRNVFLRCIPVSFISIFVSVWRRVLLNLNICFHVWPKHFVKRAKINWNIWHCNNKLQVSISFVFLASCITRLYYKLCRFCSYCGPKNIISTLTLKRWTVIFAQKKNLCKKCKLIIHYHYLLINTR